MDRSHLEWGRVSSVQLWNVVGLKCFGCRIEQWRSNDAPTVRTGRRLSVPSLEDAESDESPVLRLPTPSIAGGTLALEWAGKVFVWLVQGDRAVRVAGSKLALGGKSSVDEMFEAVPSSQGPAIGRHGLPPRKAQVMDTLTRAERSERMSRVRSSDTMPELQVRRIAYSLGFRYRLHDRSLPGKPDLVFARLKKVIFVHGCFWHRHGSRCPLTRMPKSRLDFWGPKLEENRRRDRRNVRALRGAGWDTLIVWECQLRDAEAVRGRIKTFLEGCSEIG